MAPPPIQPDITQSWLYTTQAGMVVDPRRFITADALFFPPFRVQSITPLRPLVGQGKVPRDALVGVAQVTSSAQLAFRAEQLAYHHVIQGEVTGEPWMVSF